jgi:ribosomal protein L37AE/L43A
MWLNENKVSSPPIESLVCFSNPQTIIRADSRIKAAQTVIHSHNLLSKIEKMDLKHGMPIFTEKELSKFSRKLIKTHNEEDPNILERYNIKSEEILKGVQCPNCSEISMTRKRGMWVCSGCKTKSEKAHLTALEDFSLLLGHYITHQQCKDFLGLDSSQ